jgi:hypothetical protein
MSPSWHLVTGFGVFFFLGTILFRNSNPGGSPAQPIDFNHAKHVDNGMTCADCHAGAESQARATLPTLATCMSCHEAALTQSAEEEKIRRLVSAGREPAWVQITRMPAHVYFSHRRHVQSAKLDCAMCHGPMEKATTPPERPFRLLSMDACIECHQQRQARTDCNDCHI